MFTEPQRLMPADNIFGVVCSEFVAEECIAFKRHCNDSLSQR